MALAKQTIIFHHSGMREIIIYGISGCASLFILGYTVHIFIGGLVEPQTETISIIIAVLLGASVMAWMVWDVLKNHRLK